MSKSLFDDLARTLATPMPRRRALRLIGSAVAVAALPGFRARPARARAKSTCGPGREPCSGNGLELCMQAGGVCCYYSPEASGVEPWGLLVGCRPGYRCGTGKVGERCIANCPNDKVCGDACCKDRQFCGSPKRSLCCKEGTNVCVVPGGSKGQGDCCRAGENCCFNTKNAECCGLKQTCKNSTCTCPKDLPVKCGRRCCKPGIKCCDPKLPCCDPGDHCCGKDCCRKDQPCCGDVCCGKEQSCASSIAYSKPKVCCTSDRIIVKSGKRVCCPLGTRPIASENGCCPPGDPKCCSDDDQELSCLGNAMCVKGTCQKIG